jgi:hypothetical protein
VKLNYVSSAGTDGGSRFYLSYTGSAPTAGNLNTLAIDIATIWSTTLALLTTADWHLVEVDVLDITTLSGASGLWNGTEPGTISGTALPDQVATNIEFKIARRYRGGKPRMYVPPATNGQLANLNTWDATFVTDINTQASNFFSQIEALSVGSIGVLAHVNVSFYFGFQNQANSSGRERAVPKYRTTALLDTVTGYAGKALLSSQRRRRSATTP